MLPDSVPVKPVRRLRKPSVFEADPSSAEDATLPSQLKKIASHDASQKLSGEEGRASRSTGISESPSSPGFTTKSSAENPEPSSSSSGGTRRSLVGQESSVKADSVVVQRVRRALGSVLHNKLGNRGGEEPSSAASSSQNDNPQQGNRSAWESARRRDDQNRQSEPWGGRIASSLGARDQSPRANSSYGQPNASSSPRERDPDVAKRREDESFMAKLQRAMSSPPPTWEPRRGLGPAVSIPLAPTTQPGATSKPLTLPPLDRPRGVLSDELDDDFSEPSWMPRSGHPQASILRKCSKELVA